MNPSLLLIPDRYKASKLYSQIPDSGAGDLAFTRANDTATRVNSAGLIEKVRTNLATFSEQFDNAAWLKFNATINANAGTAPNGTTTADKIVETVDNDVHVVFRGILPSGISNSSIYAKQAERKYLTLGNATFGVYAIFDLSNGTVFSISGSEIAAPKIESVGNGWYRCSVTNINNDVRTLGIGVADNSGNISYTGNGTSGILIWGYQLETGDIATPYIPTTTAAVSVGPVANIPRIDYTGGGCGKLLLEPQRTNLLTFSEQFNNAAYTKTNLTVTANTTAAPDGTTSADTAATTSSVSELYQSSSTAVTTATCSLFVKKSTHKYFGISINGTNNFDSRYQGVFDLDLGTIFQENNSTTPLTNRSSKIESYGNGWYRISVTATFATSANAFVVFQQSNNVPTIPSDNLAWNNSSIGSTFVWGAQVEAGSYVSSYIPTLGASVTRSADLTSKTGISSLIGQTEGTIFAEIEMVAGNGQIVILTSAAGNELNRVQLYIDANRKIGLYRGDVSVNIVSANAYAVGTTLKIAAVYKANDYALYVNGVSVGTDTSATAPVTPAVFYLGQYVDGSKTTTILTNAVALYPTRLSNSELASLTSL